MNRIEFLRGVDFLAGCPDVLLEQIESDLQAVQLSAGTEVFADEACGDAMYLIVDGQVRLTKNGHDLIALDSGDYLGEMALIDDGPRSAGAVAATDVSLLKWSKSHFLDLISDDGRIAYQICRSMSTKVRQNTDRVSRFQQDLQRSAEIQRAMLPSSYVKNSIVELSAHCLQAENVGGDYYDYLLLGADKFALTILDVQGHGFHAALLVAMLKASLHRQIVEDDEPGAIMRSLDQTMLNYLAEIMTATCCYLTVDRQSHVLRFCSAGHLPQYHYHADKNELERLESGSLLLGVPGGQDKDFVVEQREWCPGDLLVLFTDGLTEAFDHEEVEFGDQQIQDLISKHKEKSPKDLRQILCSALDKHRGSVSLNDDVTVVVARLM